MDDARDRLDQAEIESFIAAMAFVREYAIQFVSLAPGEVVIELPFDVQVAETSVPWIRMLYLYSTAANAILEFWAILTEIVPQPSDIPPAP